MVALLLLLIYLHCNISSTIIDLQRSSWYLSLGIQIVTVHNLNPQWFKSLWPRSERGHRIQFTCTSFGVVVQYFLPSRENIRHSDISEKKQSAWRTFIMIISKENRLSHLFYFCQWLLGVLWPTLNESHSWLTLCIISNIPQGVGGIAAPFSLLSDNLCCVDIPPSPVSD